MSLAAAGASAAPPPAGAAGAQAANASPAALKPANFRKWRREIGFITPPFKETQDFRLGRNRTDSPQIIRFQSECKERILSKPIRSIRSQNPLTVVLFVSLNPRNHNPL